MKPLLKWAGGKSKLLPELLKHVPARVGCYVEPFVGGGALFFELASRGVLNKTCFNGLWRVNRKGIFNVPWGKYKSPTIVDADAIFQASALLKKAVLAVSDFEGAVMGGGDFIYCDPPYDVVSETADFTGYTVGGFGWSDQERLERWARTYNNANADARVVMSNADTPRVRKLYGKGWKTHGVQAPRAINSKGSARGKVGELIMVKR